MSIDMSKAVSSKRAAPSYTFQRVHAALQTGHALTVQQKREEARFLPVAHAKIGVSAAVHRCGTVTAGAAAVTLAG